MCFIYKLTKMELQNQSLIDLAAFKIEVAQIRVNRDAGCVELIGNRADFAFGCLTSFSETLASAPPSR